MSISANAAYAIVSPSNATVTIIDNDLPTVTLTTTVPNAAEGGGNGAFVVSHNGCTNSAFTVNYTVSGSASNGTDYSALSGSVTISAGASSASIIVAPIDDTLAECDETVALTIVGSSSYIVGSPSSGTVTITDNDYLVNITATDANASEAGPDPGTFVISHSGCTSKPLTVDYSIGGTAGSGVDYAGIPSSVAIPAGTNAVAITINPVDDASVECDETVVLTISSSTAYTIGSSTNATVTIRDNDVPVNIAATSPNASEAGLVPGVFTVTRPCNIGSLTVNYSVGGTATPGSDYATLPGSVTIANGATSATITVTPIDDAVAECPETVVVTLSANPNYVVGTSSNATVTIADNDNTITVVASDPNASEAGLDPGAFTFSRGGCTNSALTINYTVSGTATAGVDYVALSGSATIPAGATLVVVTVTPVDNALSQCPRTVVVTISSNVNYLVGSPNSATVTIADNDSTVTIAATDASASETGPDPGVFTVTRTGCTTVGLAVSYVLSGTASNGLDYIALPGTVTIPSGASTATITVTPIDDLIAEGSETVVATIAGSNTYVVGSPSSATITIADNDTEPSLSVTSAVFSVAVGNGNAAIDPGETVQETVVLRNTGSLPATGVSGTISTTNAGITITQPTVAYPNVPGSGGTATNTTPFLYRVAKTMPCGSTITFTHVATTGSQSFTNTFSRFVGNLFTALNTNTFASSNVPKTVPNQTTVFSTNTISLAGTNFLADVNVSLRMDETRDGDLVIAIQHPDGT